MMNMAMSNDNLGPNANNMSGQAIQGDTGAIQRFAIQMASLHDLSVELSVAEGIEELCERAVRLGRIILGFDRIGIWFVDSDDPSILYGSYGTDESGRTRDERGIILHRSFDSPPIDFYEGKDPVYYIKDAPCFDDRNNLIGEADKARALLWDGRNIIGEVTVDNVITKRRIGGGDLDLLVRYARLIGYLANFKRAQSELGRLSETDELTGIVNRRTALIVLEKQFGLSKRNGGILAVAYIDLDGLKGVNDMLGHAAGDEYIKSACSLLTKVLRSTDTIGRLGGDEFLAILPDCNLDGAAAIKRRAQSMVEARNLSGEHRYAMSLSIGIAVSGELVSAGMPSTPSALIELADSRMYIEKKGRKSENRS
jgi:diguanylate cyclase (GGDEF)-like protein